MKKQLSVLMLILVVGCAGVQVPTDTFSRPQVVPVVVVPACQIPNAFEGCKLYCMAKYMHDVKSAEEDKVLIHCKCEPFKAAVKDESPQEGI